MWHCVPAADTGASILSILWPGLLSTVPCNCDVIVYCLQILAVKCPICDEVMRLENKNTTFLWLCRLLPYDTLLQMMLFKLVLEEDDGGSYETCLHSREFLSEDEFVQIHWYIEVASSLSHIEVKFKLCIWISHYARCHTWVTLCTCNFLHSCLVLTC